MKLLIFIENIQKGGVDSFCSKLINNWPNPDDTFTIVCNKSHPGRDNMEGLIERPCKFIYHNIPLSWTLSKKMIFLPGSVRRLFQPFFRLPLLPLQYFLIRNIFLKEPAEELLVVNGGFPGGESCRIANIVWYKMGRGKSTHNFHNFAVAPRLGFGWYENWLDGIFSKSVKLFISVSKACLESLKVRKTFKQIDNGICIYNGLEDPGSDKKINFDIRENIGVSKDTPVCLMLGTYEERKGHRFVFESFEQVLREVPEAHLVVCGGSSKEEFKKVDRIRKNTPGGERIHLFGFIHNGASLISQIDVLLIGSQEFESFGYTAVEAMARRKPIVSTNIGGLPEVVGTDNSCGYIVDSKDTEKFSKKVVQLLKSRELRESMGLAGRQRVKRMFAAKQMSEKYLLFIRCKKNF